MKDVDLGCTIMFIENYAKSLPSSLVTRLGSWSLLLVLARHQWHWSAVTITHPASGLADWPQTLASHWLPVSTLTSDWFPLTGHLTSGPWTEAVTQRWLGTFQKSRNRQELDFSDWKEERNHSVCSFSSSSPHLLPEWHPASEAVAQSAGGEDRDFHEMSSEQLIRDHCTTLPHDGISSWGLWWC